MDRIFLAVIVSGLLLAATSTSLLVVTGGGTAVAELNMSLPPSVVAARVMPRSQGDATLLKDDTAR